MINSPPLAIRNLALWLAAHEAIGGEPSENATFRAVEKFRESLSTLIGPAGYRSLISRALALAQKEDSSLGGVHIKEDGSLEWTGPVECEQGMDEASNGGAVLVAQLLGLLVTFIGQTFTLRLVRELWPDAPFDTMNSETEKQL
jgi:hypothetical protein